MTQDPNRRAPIYGVGQAFVLFAIALTLALFIGATLQSLWFFFGLFVTLVFLILMPAVIYVAVWHRMPVLEGLRIKPVKPLLIAMGLLAGGGGWSIAASIYFLQEDIFGPGLGQGIPIETPWLYATMLFFAALLPGICEETLFRGAILGILQRRGAWFAILVSGFLFGLFHMNPTSILPATFMGIVFGWMTVRSGSLLPAIFAHIANNVIALTVGYVFSDADAPPLELMVTLAFCFVAALLGFAALTREKPSPPLLAVAPCGLSKPVAWIFGIFSSFVVAMVVLIAILIGLFIGIIEVADDALEPHIRQGDQLVLMKIADPGELKPAETIGVRRGNQTLARVVSRVEGDRVWIREGDQEIEVEPDHILGKLLQIVPGRR